MFELESGNSDGNMGNDMVAGQARSFKKIRLARRKGRREQRRKKLDIIKGPRQDSAILERIYEGPTAETLAKLTPDPLMRFKKQNILNDQQIWAFRRIRRAVQIITDGTQMRLSRITGVVVQTSRVEGGAESDYEIRLKDHYCAWADQMMPAGLSLGPVLDVIIDELSLSAVDRKRGKRKGWAKTTLQAALDLYGSLPRPTDRDE
ncbi:hypothetical protein MNBD_ALPHA02-694 [hydrothermal vent metagenome]|uniref:Uncharacterized protein n=1 Tax=hydrothermal vent metagenome TaxID=652676 RepID=A0A3B0S2I1_9ZZZZ